MTEEQCQTCIKPTKHCKDSRYDHLINSECWNYEPPIIQPDHKLMLWEKAGMSRSQYVQNKINEVSDHD